METWRDPVPVEERPAGLEPRSYRPMVKLLPMAGITTFHM